MQPRPAPQRRQYLLVGLPRKGRCPGSEYLRHRHAEGPDVPGGRLFLLRRRPLEEGLRCRPTQRDATVVDADVIGGVDVATERQEGNLEVEEGRD